MIKRIESVCVYGGVQVWKCVIPTSSGTTTPLLTIITYKRSHNYKAKYKWMKDSDPEAHSRVELLISSSYSKPIYSFDMEN